MPPILGQPPSSKGLEGGDSRNKDASHVALAIQFPGTEPGAMGAGCSLREKLLEFVGVHVRPGL